MAAGIGHDGSFAFDALAGRAHFAVDRDIDAAAGDVFPVEVSGVSEPALWRPAPGAWVVVPPGLAPQYPYPLLVSLADDPSRHQEFVERVRQAGSRNYVAMSLDVSLLVADRGSGELALGERERLSLGMQRYHSLLQAVESSILIHPRRRFVIGYGSSWGRALHWVCSQPDWFAGAVVVAPQVDQVFSIRTDSDLMQGRPLLWLSENGGCSLEETAALAALKSLGLQVTRRLLSENDSVEEQINRWVLAQIPSSVDQRPRH